MIAEYAELHCLSNFSFLRGASHPEELIERAHELGYRALALTDECSVAGAVRAHVRAKELGLDLIIGAEFALADGLRLVLLATDRDSYGNLTELITRARRRALQDTLTAVRLKCTLQEAGYRLHPNGERHLRERKRLAELYPSGLLAQTVCIAERCDFSLDCLRYEYPEELVPVGKTPISY